MTEIRKENIEHLVAELKRQKENSMDFVATSGSIQAVPHIADGVRLVIPTPKPVPKKADGEVEQIDLTPLDDQARQSIKVSNALSHEMVPTYGMTEWAHDQVAKKMGIPKRYYNKLLQLARSDEQVELNTETKASGAADLLSKNINYWMGARDTRLIRILDGRVRAFLSELYRPIDNWDLVWKFMDTVKRNEMLNKLTILECDLTETRMYIKAKIDGVISEIMPGDKVEPLLLIKNSEVGAGRFQIQLGMWRLVCSNGLHALDILAKVHIGTKLDVGLVEWSEETLRKNDEALFAQLGDAIKTALSTETWEGFVTRTRQIGKLNLEPDIVQIVENVSPKYNLSEEEQRALLESFTGEIGTGSKNVWALANGMTAMAKNIESADRQIEIEEKAGQILITPPTEIMSMVPKLERNIPTFTA